MAILVVLLAALSFGLLRRYARSAEEAAVRSLPYADRSALYQRTLTTLETSCSPAHRAGLDTFCSGQANFILQFSECDAACRKLAGSILEPAPRPRALP